MSSVPSTVFKVRHDTDPSIDIKKALGDISGIKLAPGSVLLGIYKRPDKIGSILRADTTKDEDVWQGKSWLVLAIGPLAFEDSDQGHFGGFKPEVGDWVLARANDGYRTDIQAGDGNGGHQCLFINHRYIKGVIPSPFMVW